MHTQTEPTTRTQLRQWFAEMFGNPKPEPEDAQAEPEAETPPPPHAEAEAEPETPRLAQRR